MAGSVDSRVAQSPGGEFAPPSRRHDVARSSRSRHDGVTADGARTASAEEDAGCAGARDKGQVTWATTERIADVSRQRGTDAVWSGIDRGPGVRSRTRRHASPLFRCGRSRVRQRPVTVRGDPSSRPAHGARRGLASDPRGRRADRDAAACSARRDPTGKRRGGRPGNRPAGSCRDPGRMAAWTTSPRTTTGRAGPCGPYPENRGGPRTRPCGADTCQGAGTRSGGGSGAKRSRPGHRSKDRTTSPAVLFGRVTPGGAGRSRDRSGRARGANL